MPHSDLRVPYALTVFGEEEVRAVNDVLQTPQIVAGKRAQEFEEKIAKLFGKQYGLFVNSGSSANLLAIETLNLPKGSEVVTPVLTFATTVAPIVQKGLIPVFVDVEPESYLASIDQVEEAITERTKALMIPSLFGNIPDWPRLKTLAAKRNICLIEDSCDTLGATIGGEPTGIYSDISTTSFYASHIITAAGEGGMFCVNDPRWYRKARVLSGWGRRSALNETEDIEQRYQTSLNGTLYDSKFVFEEIGYNMRTTDLAAAFALAQLKKLDQLTLRRVENFKFLREFFLSFEKFFILPRQLEHVQTNWLAFPLTIRPEAPFTRFEVVKYLESHHIQTRPIFTGNVLRQPGFEKIRRIERQEGYPHADQIMRNGFVVGCHHGIGRKHLAHLETVFSEFLKAC